MILVCQLIGAHKILGDQGTSKKQNKQTNMNQKQKQMFDKSSTCEQTRSIILYSIIQIKNIIMFFVCLLLLLMFLFLCFFPLQFKSLLKSVHPNNLDFLVVSYLRDYFWACIPLFSDKYFWQPSVLEQKSISKGWSRIALSSINQFLLI